ncbi:MAG: energy transducer TonB [endosymbiont of Galathealinum brachiosum]|uniref:Energy transducer TonB n=1 Tax=endosymbiont of Galathealinum brachiosum TaxID=2200906 RepID=A0A370DFH7_9GAMM|nr:MAG: energy transducer TonB [endosymbiont of Galathealinum brachiosum]
MSRINTWDEPFLPWVQSANDRRFLKILLASVVFFTLFGIAVPFLPTSEPVKKDLKTVSPRLAKLIMEQRKLPPPIPKPVKPKAKPKPKVKEKPKTKKPLKKPVKKKLNKKQKVARKTAATSGLMSMASELNDLRDTFDLSDIEDQSLSKAGKTKTKDFSSPAVISSTAMKSSGGIKNSQLSRSTGGGKLSSRQTAKVSSNIATGSAKKTVKRNKSGKVIRPQYEIEQVFQKNKSAIYTIYNRALRKDPTLQGKVVIELTIASNGTVIKARILSSDLNNKKLERKLIARVKLFRFKPSNAAKVTVKYPIDFLPS